MAYTANSVKYGATLVMAPGNPLLWEDLSVREEPNAITPPRYFDRVLSESSSSTVSASLAGVPSDVAALAVVNNQPQNHAVDSTEEARVPNAGQTIRDVQARSGLTWKQLAKAIGVSRRTLYVWANGGTMSALHSERLAKFETLVRKYDTGDPAATRFALLRNNRRRVKRL